MAEKQEATKQAAPQEKAPVVVDELVEVRCLRPFIHNKIVLQPGQKVRVTREEALELTKDFGGTYAFRGERYTEDGDAKKHAIKRAEYVALQAS